MKNFVYFLRTPIQESTIFMGKFSWGLFSGSEMLSLNLLGMNLMKGELFSRRCNFLVENCTRGNFPGGNLPVGNFIGR